MIEAGGVFDAWGSSVLGGIAGAVVALATVFVAQHLADRRRTASERRLAAETLVIEVSNLRDAVAYSDDGLYGNYDLFPLRNVRLSTYSDLSQFESYAIVEQLYDSVRDLRSWLRRHTPTSGQGWAPDLADQIDAYRKEVYQYSVKVIAVLQDHLEAKTGTFERPAPPAHPTFMDALEP
jgi:hypothetical protein